MASLEQEQIENNHKHHNNNHSKSSFGRSNNNRSNNKLPRKSLFAPQNGRKLLNANGKDIFHDDGGASNQIIGSLHNHKA